MSFFFLYPEGRSVSCCQTAFVLQNTHLNIFDWFHFLFFFFFLLLSYCFLQKETRGPLRPRRPRAPPAKKPREVEVHPKLRLRPKGVKSREEASERVETWRKDRVCVLVVPTGDEDTYALAAGMFGASAAQMFRLFIGSDCNVRSRTDHWDVALVLQEAQELWSHVCGDELSWTEFIYNTHKHCSGLAWDRVSQGVFIIIRLSLSFCVRSRVCDALVLVIFFCLVTRHSRHYAVVYGLHIYCLMFSDNLCDSQFLYVIKYLWITVTSVFCVFKCNWLFTAERLQDSVKHSRCSSVKRDHRVQFSELIQSHKC